MKKILFIAVLASFFPGSFAQDINSPPQFLGYELGSQFTFHSNMVDYFTDIADKSPEVLLFKYGATNEGRPLIACFISSEENIKKLEEYRTNNLRSIGLLDGEPGEGRKPFVWLSYNVHGNESVGMETSMKVLYEFLLKRKVYQAVGNQGVHPDQGSRHINHFPGVFQLSFGAVVI